MTQPSIRAVSGGGGNNESLIPPKRSGYVADGDVGCCVHFMWVEGGRLRTHNFGDPFWNWSGCYLANRTVRTCLVP